MIPLNRAGWLVGTLAVGFALGYSFGTLRGPKGISGSALDSSGKTNLQPAAYTLSSAAASVASTEGTSTAGGNLASDDESPGERVGFSAALSDALKIGDSSDRTIRIHEIIRTLSVEEIPDAFEQAKRLSFVDQWQVLSALGNRWAQLDLKGALDFGLKSGRIGPYGGYNNFLHATIENWAGTDPSEAVAWVKSLPPGDDRNGLMTALLTVIGRKDPQAAVQLLRTQQGNRQEGWAVEQLFSEWAVRDPQAAATAALDLKDDSAIRGTAQAWARSNPHAAMAWVEKLPDGPRRKYAVEAVVMRWAEADPIGVIAWSRNLQDEEERRGYLANGIAYLAAKDLSGALAQIGSLSAGEDRDQAVMAAAQTVAKRDARSAVQLLEQLEPSFNRTRAMSSLCEMWAASEPREALDWLFQNGTPSKGDQSVSRVVGMWAERDPDQAFAWVQQLPAGESRQTAMAGLATSMVYRDPTRAQQLFSQLSLEAQTAISEQFISNLTREHLDKARAWAEELPPGKAQSTAYGAIGYQMATKNVASAAQWIETLPPGRGRDKAVIGFSNHAIERDPEGALTWAFTIADETDRTIQVGYLVEQWMGRDSASAWKWLNTTNQLTPAQKRRLQER